MEPRGLDSSSGYITILRQIISLGLISKMKNLNQTAEFFFYPVDLKSVHERNECVLCLCDRVGEKVGGGICFPVNSMALQKKEKKWLQNL